MRYLEQRVSTPDKIVLTKIFSDNKNVIKLRKNDPAWASKPVKELDKELRKIMEENDIEHHRMSVELITPRGKATPFLKLTFLTQNDRRDATKKLNAVKTSTSFTISPIEPREVQSWLPHYRKAARANILSCLQ